MGKVVEVGVKIDNEGDACYFFGGKYYSLGLQEHDKERAARAAYGAYQEFTESAAEKLNLPSAPIIHTYHIEVNES